MSWASSLVLRVTHCTSGNLNNHLGVPLSLLGIELNQHKFAVDEAGINGKGEMQDLAKDDKAQHCIGHKHRFFSSRRIRK